MTENMFQSSEDNGCTNANDFSNSVEKEIVAAGSGGNSTMRQAQNV